MIEFNKTIFYFSTLPLSSIMTELGSVKSVASLPLRLRLRLKSHTFPLHLYRGILSKITQNVRDGIPTWSVWNQITLHLIAVKRCMQRRYDLLNIIIF